jgi:hypothetical protein
VFSHGRWIRATTTTRDSSPSASRILCFPKLKSLSLVNDYRDWSAADCEELDELCKSRGRLV